MQDSFNGWNATFLSLDERRQADRATTLVTVLCFVLRR